MPLQLVKDEKEYKRLTERSKNLLELSEVNISDKDLDNYYVIISSDQNDLLSYDQHVILFSDYESAEKFAVLAKRDTIIYKPDLMIVLPMHLYLKNLPYKKMILGDKVQIKTIISDYISTGFEDILA